MALGTVSVVGQAQIGPLKIVTYSVQLSSGANWTAAGETFDVSQATRGAYAGFKTVDAAFVGGAAGGRQVAYTRAADGAPATGTLVAYYYNYPAAAAGTAIPVPDNTNLSDVTVQVTVVGR